MLNLSEYDLEIFRQMNIRRTDTKLLLLLDKHFISYNDKLFLYRDEIFLKS